MPTTETSVRSRSVTLCALARRPGATQEIPWRAARGPLLCPHQQSYGRRPPNSGGAGRRQVDRHPVRHDMGAQMDWWNPAIAVAGLLVGIVVGLTGMGGGALMTPVLVFFFGV